MNFMKNVEEFIDDLSNWYVRRNRRRFWRSERDHDKKVAYFTLHHVLVTLIKILAPVIPFMTEEMYQNLVAASDPSAPESVHHCEFPKVDQSFVDEKLVADVDHVIKIVKAGRALRNKSNMKVRQPAAQLVIRPDASMKLDSLKKYEKHIQEELNVKKVTFIEDDADLVQYEVKIDFKKLGPKYGKDVPKIQKLVQELPAAEVVKKARARVNIEVKLDGRVVGLEPDEIVVETKARENFIVQESDGCVLGLDTFLTEELLSEGLARDLVRHIQELRKEADFEMNDRIHLYYEGSEKLRQTFTRHADYIRMETLSLEINDHIGDGALTKEIKIGGEKVTLGVKR
jgi:isoleucyl-tRNA synthetase